MTRISQFLGGNRLMARVARSASWIVLGYGASQAIRLASNLILTRLLFPEAFGLMALVGVVTVGLTLFSDVGIAPSIAQSKRGMTPIS
ncbi:oligosaccharide flippase family protein [Sulfitobacter sediminilitoris]